MESSTPLVSFSAGTRGNGSSSSSGVRRGTDASSFSATMGPASAASAGGGAKSKRFNLGRVLSSGSVGAGGGRAGGQVRIYI